MSKKLSNDPTAQVFKPITIGHIHKELLDWIKDCQFKIINADGNQLKASIINIGSEKWDIVKNKFLMRDEHDRLILPVIGVEYTAPKEDFSKIAGFPRHIGENGNIIVQRKVISEGNMIAKNKELKKDAGEIDNYIELTNGYIWEERYIRAPIFLSIPYKLYFKAQFQDHLTILQSQFFSKVPAKSVFEIEHGIVYVDNNGFVAENNWLDQTQDERTIECSINLEVACYIMPDEINKEASSKSAPSLSRIKLDFQYEDDD